MGSNEGLQQVSRLVNTFLNRPDTLAFRTPVDPKAMNIPDYFQIVKNPMDLGTVKAKLEGGRYDRAEDVARDIRLIWSNCILYNSPGSEFGLLAAGLAKKFEERFSKIADKDREKKPSLRLDPIDTRSPSLDEKVRFTYDLYRTTKVEVGQVMEQVDARCPQALKSPAEDEVELNVDMLDPLTFRVVERLIREALLGAATASASSAASAAAVAASSSSSSITSSSGSKSKSGGGGGGGGGGGPKKRKGSDGESRPKKQRT